MGKGKRSHQRLARELCAGPGALMPDEVRAGAGVLVLDAGELRAFMELTDGLFDWESAVVDGVLCDDPDCWLSDDDFGFV